MLFLIFLLVKAISSNEQIEELKIVQNQNLEKIEETMKKTVSFEKFYENSEEDIKNLFFTGSYEKIIFLGKNEKRFKESDLPYLYFTMKYFDGKPVKEYLLASSENILSLLMIIRESFNVLSHNGERYNLDELIYIAMDRCKHISEKFREKIRPVQTRILYSEYNRNIDLHNLVYLAISGVENVIDELIAHLNNNIEEAHLIIEELEQIDDPRVHSLLGIVYYNGIKVDRCITKAIRFFKAGAEKGDITSLNGLGFYYMNMYSKNTENKEYLRKAQQYYNQSASRNSQEGIYNQNIISKILFKGFTPKHWLNSYYIQTRYLPSQYNMIERLNRQKNLTETLNQIRWLLLWDDEICELEKRALNAYKEEDYEKCFTYLLFLIECGSEESLQNIIYLMNKKIMRNRIVDYALKTKRNGKLEQLYFSALKTVNSKITFNYLGNCYYYGIGTDINYTKAALYYSFGSFDNILGKYNYAYMLDRGLGIPKNNMAAHLLLKSAKFHKTKDRLLIYIARLRNYFYFIEDIMRSVNFEIVCLLTVFIINKILF